MCGNHEILHTLNNAFLFFTGGNNNHAAEDNDVKDSKTDKEIQTSEIRKRVSKNDDILEETHL